MTDIDLDHIEDIVRAKAALERKTKQGDIETVTNLVRAERFATATFKELKTTAKECINRYNATAVREVVPSLKVTADSLRAFTAVTADEKGSFSLAIEGATITYSRATRQRPLEEWTLRANDTARVRAKLMEFLWEA